MGYKGTHRSKGKAGCAFGVVALPVLLVIALVRLAVRRGR